MSEEYELYPLDQWEANPENATFKVVMTQVVYTTTGIYFDRVDQSPDGESVVCQLWTKNRTGETMGWYGISTHDLRTLDVKTLVEQSREHCMKVYAENYTKWDAPAPPHATVGN
ncbi:MAG: hypothetical protein M0Z43_13525 [Acidithiobacillus sp.]|nr:hypothetical protein [Acidithiobacillus sp.]